MQKWIGKWDIRPCKIVPLENIILKLCMRYYVRDTYHANFGFNWYSGASTQIGKILQLCDFFTILTFFTILHPGRTAGPTFTLYGSNDVFPHKDGPLRG